MPKPRDNVDFVQKWLSHYNDHERDPKWLDKAIADIDDNSEHNNAAKREKRSGPEGLKDLVLFFSEAFPGSRVDITNAFATEDQVVLEFTGRGTNTGPLRMPSGEIPPTGREAELQFVQTFRINPAGKIKSFNTYYDQQSLLQQLGLA